MYACVCEGVGVGVGVCMATADVVVFRLLAFFLWEVFAFTFLLHYIKSLSFFK